MANSHLKKSAKIGLKVLGTVVLAYFLIKKVEWEKVFELILTVQIPYLLLATLAYVISQWVSSERLLLSLKRNNIPISRTLNFKLYLKGMFLNLFIPGGIGGDGYKVWYLKRVSNELKIPKLINILLQDRIIGLAGVLVLIGIIYPFSNFEGIDILPSIALLLIPVAILGLYLELSYFLPELIRILPTLFIQSIVVQVLQVTCVILIILAFDFQPNWLVLAIVFLISSIAIVLPLSIGGLGARETVFVLFATQMDVEAFQAVSVCLLFYFITFVIAAVGGLVQNPSSQLDKTKDPSN
jgi:uncharacterized membrane protein YbhN (UPF0104 family)